MRLIFSVILLIICKEYIYFRSYGERVRNVFVFFVIAVKKIKFVLLKLDYIYC